MKTVIKIRKIRMNIRYTCGHRTDNKVNSFKYINKKIMERQKPSYFSSCRGNNHNRSVILYDYVTFSFK